MTIKTADQVRAELKRKGVSITQWALANKLAPNLVFDVLGGRKKGDRGEAHRAAVLLGMKEGEVVAASQVHFTHHARRAA